MENQELEKYIRHYTLKNNNTFQDCKIGEYNFTFMVVDDETIGTVLDMGSEPHIYILEEHRRKGFGYHLLKQYVKDNLRVRNTYIFYNGGTEEGLYLIKKLKDKQLDTYKVIEVGYRKYIILRDYRID